MKTFIFPIKNRSLKKKLGFQVRQAVYSLIQLKDALHRVEFISSTRNYVHMHILDVHLLIFLFTTSGRVLWVRADDHLAIGTWSSIDDKGIVMEAEFEYMDSLFCLSVHKDVVSVRDMSSHSFYLMNQHYRDRDHYRAILMIPSSP